MRAVVMHPGELASGELARWHAFQQASAHLDNPFLAPGYALAVDRVRDCVRLAVLEDDQAVVGFFCYDIHGGRAAKPLGGGLSDCEGIVHAPGWRWSPRDLLRACGLTSWGFESLVEEQVPDGVRGVQQPIPVMDLTDGYQAYLEDRRGNCRKSVQTVFRKQRKMEREIGELRFEFDDRNPMTLQTLIQWKSDQYRRMSEWDRFAVPWITQLVWDLFDCAALGCSGTLSVLYVADKPAAAYFGLRSSSTLACWFPAYDPALAQYSPGILLHFMMAEAAASRGIGLLNLGRGDHGYKNTLKTGDLVVARGAVDDSSPRALLRRAARAPRRYLGPWVKGHPHLDRVARWTIGRLQAR